MSATGHQALTASTGRMVLISGAALFGLLLLGAIALWAKLGSVVFFELIAAGIAYCF